MTISPRVWYESAAFDGLSIVNYASDPEASLEDNHYIKGPIKVAGLIGRGANLAEMQLNVSGDTVPLCETAELQTLASDFTAEDVIPVHRSINDKEKLSLKADNGNVSEATGIVMLIDGGFWIGSPPPKTAFRVIQVSSTTPAVAGEWKALSMSYPGDLPGGGTMRVFGMRCKSASGYAIRVIQGDRPGIPTQHSEQGPFIWFEEPFDIDLANKPSFEILSSTTTAVHNLELAAHYKEA